MPFQVTSIAYANAREIEPSEDGSSVIDDRKSMSDGNSAFNDLTVDESFDDASTGTDYRVIQILSLSQNEKNQQLLDAAAAGHESECALLLKYGASTQRLDWHTQTTPFQVILVDSPPVRIKLYHRFLTGYQLHYLVG